MTEFEKVLEQGVANIDECMRRYPKHALQLEPVLLTAEYLIHGREARPSAAFKSRVRRKVIQQMHTHPQKSTQFNFIFMRFAANLAAIVLALVVAGTVYAQSALPGEAFYDWKLASENAWRAVSPDPVGTDLMIADRRVDELIAVNNNPVLHSQALDAYLQVVARLQSELGTENDGRIFQALDSQTEELNSSGILLPKFDQLDPLEDVLPQFDEPTPTPTVTPALLPEIPQVNPTSSNPTVIHPPTVIPPILTGIPPVISTNVPNIVPTIQVPLELIPTIQVTLPIP
jgi:hypothetical protein